MAPGGLRHPGRAPAGRRIAGFGRGPDTGGALQRHSTRATRTPSTSPLEGSDRDSPDDGRGRLDVGRTGRCPRVHFWRRGLAYALARATLATSRPTSSRRGRSRKSPSRSAAESGLKAECTRRGPPGRAQYGCSAWRRARKRRSGHAWSCCGYEPARPVTGAVLGWSARVSPSTPGASPSSPPTGCTS